MNPTYWLHLGRRFFESCRPGAPAASDVVWVRDVLSEAEFTLWCRLSNPDQRHSVAVARAVRTRLADAAESVDESPEWATSAALLHDVGKVVCGYRTPARVVATVIWAIVPSDRAEVWQRKPWPRRRLAQYHLHPALGGELCCDAGAHRFTCSWAAEHHLDADRWTVPQAIGAVLKDCDDD